MLQNQAYIFLIFILEGIIIGILFDIFRILRKSFKTKDILTNIEDIIFTLLAGLLILFSIMKFNNGELRVYLFLGIILGLTLYLLIFSNIFITINVAAIKVMKKIIKIIIIIPLRFITKIIRKTVFKPVVFLCFNIKKVMHKIMIPKIRRKR